MATSAEQGVPSPTLPVAPTEGHRAGIAHRLAAVSAALVAGAWATDYMVLPGIWATWKPGGNWGEAFQRADAACLVLEMLALGTLTLAVMLDVGTSWWTVTGVVLAAVAVAAAVPIGLYITVTAARWWQGPTLAGWVLMGAALVTVNTGAVVTHAYRRWVSVPSLVVGALLLFSLLEYGIAGTSLSYTLLVLGVPVWSMVYFALMLAGPHPPGWAGRRPVAPAQPAR